MAHKAAQRSSATGAAQRPALVKAALVASRAAYAPYMEGAAVFNMTTVVATEVMHLVSGACVYLALTRGAVAR